LQYKEDILQSKVFIYITIIILIFTTTIVAQNIPQMRVSGDVTLVEQNDIGGWEVIVDGVVHTIAPGRAPVVTVGNRVLKGDRLSDGAIKPQELSAAKDHLTAQRYIVDEISDIFGGSFHKKTMETVVRGISDNAIIEEAPEDSGYYRGDKGTVSYLKRLNKSRVNSGLDPVKYRPYFKSVDTLNVDNEDWLTKVTTNRVKDALQKGMAKMQ